MTVSGAETTMSGTSHEPAPARTTSDGHLILFYAKALYDYIPTIADELNFRVGDLIAVTHAPLDGWWRGELEDEARRAWHTFPSNYVSVPTMSDGDPQPGPAPDASHTSDDRPVLFHAKARYDYTPTTDAEFAFQRGDLIAVTATPAHGWWQGELADASRRQPGGHEFPSNFVSAPRWTPPVPSVPTAAYTDDGRSVLFYVQALYDYTASISEEFDFKAGDVIAVIDAPEDGWWIGELADETRREPGRDVFPSNFVVLL